MRRLLYFGFLMVVMLGVGTVSLAQDPPYSLQCVGSKCGGSGVRQYEYTMQYSRGAPVVLVQLGTHDGNPAHYTDWLMPQGWNVALIQLSGYADRNEFTSHGSTSPGSDGECPYVVRWTGPGITEIVHFGFNNPHGPHDVSWCVSGGIDYAICDWSAEVGLGQGPVHAPGVAPEPSGLLALGTGLLGLLALLRRRRNSQ